MNELIRCPKCGEMKPREDYYGVRKRAGFGMITLVNADKVRPKRDPGRCFRKAGFQPCGYTKSGLVVLQLLPDVMPAPAMPYGSSPSLFATA